MTPAQDPIGENTKDNYYYYIIIILMWILILMLILFLNFILFLIVAICVPIFPFLSFQTYEI